MRLLLTLALTLAARSALSACAPQPMDTPQAVGEPGGAVLIVTHATAVHDPRLATKRGVDEAVRYARADKIPVVYLQDDSPAASYFADECAPEHRVWSGGGEISFELRASHLYVVGGHLEMCLSATLHDVLLQWSRRPPRDFTVSVFMDGIYSNGKAVEDSDPWYPEFERFMAAVTYGRPGGESWPKITLLETLGVIRNEARQREYLIRTLPHWARTFSADYRVGLILGDGDPYLLQAGTGSRPPTLRFRFLDSALEAVTEGGAALNSPRSSP